MPHGERVRLISVPAAISEEAWATEGAGVTRFRTRGFAGSIYVWCSRPTATSWRCDRRRCSRTRGRLLRTRHCEYEERGKDLDEHLPRFRIILVDQLGLTPAQGSCSSGCGVGRLQDGPAELLPG